jgi:anti-sigma regulatory factor (Ser/Thr protein kinase)
MQLHGQSSVPESPTTLKAKIKNRLSEIDGFNQRYWEFAEALGVQSAISQSLILAFDELLSNIIYYAYQDDNEHEIEIQVDLTETSVTATIMDDGVAFNPFGLDEPDTTTSLQSREIGGLGIHLVRQIIDQVSYEHRDGKNVVTLIQYR